MLVDDCFTYGFYSVSIRLSGWIVNERLLARVKFVPIKAGKEHFILENNYGKIDIDCR